MNTKFNSFYGNASTRRSPVLESLKDIFRRAKLSNVYCVGFFTPEIRGVSYEDRENPKTNGFQIVVELTKFPTYNPRWTVSLQQTDYSGIEDKKSEDQRRVVSERVIAENVSTQDAFDIAMNSFSELNWGQDKNDFSRAPFIYAPKILDNLKPVSTKNTKDPAPFFPVTWMPAWENVRMETHRLAEKRAETLNRLLEHRNHVQDYSDLTPGA